MTAEPWEHLAACTPHPTHWWFPERTDGTDNHGTHAKAVCAQCPALRPCLEAALDRREEHGIWGGAGGDHLRALRRAWLTGGDRWEQAFVEHVARLDGTVVDITDRNGPGATHGLAVTYARGCRCAPCRLAVPLSRAPSLVVVGDRTDAAEVAHRQAGAVPAFLTPITRKETA